MTLSIETPALLFSATSLILLAYTNRFLTIAQIIRGLKTSYEQHKTKSILLQIENLRKRINLIRDMQVIGVASLFFSVLAMLLIFVEQNTVGIVFFGFSLASLLFSLGLSMYEISISVVALKHHLDDLAEN